MQMEFGAWCALTAVGVVVVLIGEARGRRSLVYLAKPLASLGFLGAALGLDPLSSPYGQGVFAALLLSAAGDVLLMLPQSGAFRLGLFSFLLGHVAYGLAFAWRGVSWTVVALFGVLLAPIAVAVGRWLKPHAPSGMWGPILAYIIVITIMVALAAGASLHVGAPLTESDLPSHGRIDVRILVGAVAFWLSDISVARNRFVAPGLVNRLWGLPLYYGAQLLLASTLGGAWFGELGW